MQKLVQIHWIFTMGSHQQKLLQFSKKESIEGKESECLVEKKKSKNQTHIKIYSKKGN